MGVEFKAITERQQSPDAEDPQDIIDDYLNHLDNPHSSAWDKAINSLDWGKLDSDAG